MIEQTENMQAYIGCKIIMARPMTHVEFLRHQGNVHLPQPAKDISGYMVQYPDGYESWSPKGVFEKVYFMMGDDSSLITPKMVEQFAGVLTSKQIDDKTTLVKCDTITGFAQYEVSSCVDPKNYDHKVGVDTATKRIYGSLWKCLGFVLQWGKFGLKQQ